MYGPAQSYPQAAQSYQQVGVQTASPARLVAMLFSAFDARLAQVQQAAAQASSASPVADAALQRALAILGELEASLDLEQGGSLAANLLALYRYMRERLRASDRQAALAEVHRLVAPLNAAWAELADSAPAASGMTAAVA